MKSTNKYSNEEQTWPLTHRKHPLSPSCGRTWLVSLLRRCLGVAKECCSPDPSRKCSVWKANVSLSKGILIKGQWCYFPSHRTEKKKPHSLSSSFKTFWCLFQSHFLYNYHGIHQKTAGDDFCCVHHIAEGFTWCNLHGQLHRPRKKKQLIRISINDLGKHKCLLISLLFKMQRWSLCYRCRYIYLDTKKNTSEVVNGTFG